MPSASLPLHQKRPPIITIIIITTSATIKGPHKMGSRKTTGNESDKATGAGVYHRRDACRAQRANTGAGYPICEHTSSRPPGAVCKPALYQVRPSSSASSGCGGCSTLLYHCNLPATVTVCVGIQHSPLTQAATACAPSPGPARNAN